MGNTKSAAASEPNDTNLSSQVPYNARVEPPVENRNDLPRTPRSDPPNTSRSDSSRSPRSPRTVESVVLQSSQPYGAAPGLISSGSQLQLSSRNSPRIDRPQGPFSPQVSLREMQIAAPGRDLKMSEREHAARQAVEIEVSCCCGLL